MSLTTVISEKHRRALHTIINSAVSKFNLETIWLYQNNEVPERPFVGLSIISPPKLADVQNIITSSDKNIRCHISHYTFYLSIHVFTTDKLVNSLTGETDTSYMVKDEIYFTFDTLQAREILKAAGLSYLRPAGTYVRHELADKHKENKQYISYIINLQFAYST